MHQFLQLTLFYPAAPLLCFLVSPEHCLEIARLRRTLMAQSKSRVLFLDETYVRIGTVSRSTLVAPGETNYVVVADTTAYAPRYDMIACCSGDCVFPPIIFSQDDRQEWGRTGVGKEMVNYYIQDMLAQAVGALDQYPITLVIDKSRAHNIQEMLECFHESGCQDLQTICFMPTCGAKRMSPLDNALFHQWKEGVRKRGPMNHRNITQTMADVWNNIDQRTLRAYYHHCGLFNGTDPYFDCPDPSSHRHPRP